MWLKVFSLVIVQQIHPKKSGSLCIYRINSGYISLCGFHIFLHFCNKPSAGLDCLANNLTTGGISSLNQGRSTEIMTTSCSFSLFSTRLLLDVQFIYHIS